jgi:uncharacterized protein YkwD
MRSSITKRLALIAMIPATLFAIVLLASPANAAAVSSAQLSAGIVTLTNQQRAAHGCKAVKVDARLVAAAAGHSSYMARTGSFSHTGSGGSSFSTRVTRAAYPRPLSENVAFGYRTAADVMKGWMASPGHRANILNCKASTVGVSTVYAANGNPYYTQDFGF